MSQENLETYLELFERDVQNLTVNQGEIFEIPGEDLTSDEVQLITLLLSFKGIFVTIEYGCGDPRCEKHKNNPVPHKFYLEKSRRADV